MEEIQSGNTGKDNLHECNISSVEEWGGEEEMLLQALCVLDTQIKCFL
jgi:hypothetical protein